MTKIRNLMESSQIFWGLSAFVILFSYVRIFFGADTTDEAYYVAISLLSTQGATPFVNDMYFQQNASLVYEPLSYLYHLLFGYDGIVLFVRHLYFLMSIAASATLFCVFRKFIRSELAAAIVLLPISFVPYGIPSLGYNTISGFFYIMGVGFMLNAILSEKRRLMLAMTSISFALSVFAYPMFVIGVATAVALAMIWSWRNDLKIIRKLIYMSGLSAGLAIALWMTLLYRASWEDLKTSLDITLRYGALGDIAAKIDYGASIFRFYTPSFWEIAGVLFVGAALRRFFSLSWLWVMAALCVLTLIRAPEEIGFASHFMITLVSFLSIPAIFIAMRDMRKEFWVASIVFVPSLLLSLILGWTSANSFLIMALVTQYCIVAFIFIEIICKSTRFSTWVSLFALYGIILYFGFRYVYRDDPIPKLTHMVKSGPYAGIMTTKIRFDLLKDFENDIEAAAQVGNSVVFYDYFPAGFIFSSLYPATRSIFIHPLPYGWPPRKMYVEFYEDPKNRPDIVFQIETYPILSNSTAHFRPEWTKSPNDTFFDFLPNTGDYELFRVRDHYKVWIKKAL